MSSSATVTRGVRVEVRVRYSPDHSNPGDQLWFFLYTIRITNEGSVPVQLVSRRWLITDGTGEVNEVSGPGVVGEQPRLNAGESFEYTSGCPLPTPFGEMCGSYQMVVEGGEGFDAEIGSFSLREPGAIH